MVASRQPLYFAQSSQTAFSTRQNVVPSQPTKTKWNVKHEGKQHDAD